MDTIKRNCRKRAFTLVEMLLVMIIIAILAGALVLTFGRIERKSNYTVDIANIRTAKSAALMAYAENTSAGEVRYAYDDGKAVLIEGELPPVHGYGKSAFGEWKEEYGALGNPVSANGASNYLIVSIKKGKVSVIWSDYKSISEECTANNTVWTRGTSAVKGNIYYYEVKGSGGYYIAVNDDSGNAPPPYSSNFAEINEDKYIKPEEMKKNIGTGDVYRDSQGDLYVWSKSDVYYYDIDKSGEPSEHPELWTRMNRK